MTDTTTYADNDYFTCIEPHPYGVLPPGNAYFSSQDDDRVPKSLQIPLAEELFQQVLSFCDGKSLGRVVQVCRDWYVAGHVVELWRDLVLRQCENGRIDEFTNCWKDTLVKLLTGKLDHPHVPMSMPHQYSQVQYKTHACRSFSIPKSWLTTEGGTVERITQTSLSTTEFLSKYEEPNVPVVLAGACRSWRAFQEWNSIDYLEKACKSASFRATSGACPLSASFTLSAYHDYCVNHTPQLMEEAPLYLFDRTALTQPDSVLKNDYQDDLRRSCPFWNADSNTESCYDLFQYLGHDKRPDHTWLICGPQHSGSSFHVDPNATHAWNACISGRKRWIFYPPGITPPGVYPSLDGDLVTMPISIGEWLLNFYTQEHLPNLQSSHSNKRPLECTVEPGDVVFVPHGWWHAVINLDDWNVAITHNYVSGSNLSNVLRFLSLKQSQISGCRDRTESIKPEFLRGALERALVKHGFESVLKQAQEIAEKRWTCRTWTDDSEEGDDGASRDDKKKQTTLALCTTHNKRKRAQQHECNGNSIMSRAKKNIGNQAFSFSFL